MKPDIGKDYIHLLLAVLLITILLIVPSLAYGSEVVGDTAVDINDTAAQNPYYDSDAYRTVYKESTSPSVDDSAVGTSDDSRSRVSPGELGFQADPGVVPYAEKSEWSLINMLLVLLGIAFLVPLLVSKRDRRDAKHSMFLLSGVLLLLMSIAVFFTVHNLSSPMVLVDVWTIVHVALFAGELAFLLLSFESKQQKLRREMQGVMPE